MSKKQINTKLALLAAILFLNIFNFFTIKDIKYSVDSLRNQIDDINSNLDDSINNISFSVSNALKKEASLINDFKYEYGKVKDGKLDLNFTVNPKEISSENEYFFSYDIDGEEKVVNGVVSGTSKVVSSTTVPIDSSLNINFIVKDGNQRKVESLGYFSSFESILTEPFDFESTNNGISFSQSDKKIALDNMSFNIHFTNSYVNEYEENESKKSLNGIKICVAVNGKIKDSFDMKKSDYISESFMETYQYTFEKYSLTLKPKDRLEIYALADHQDGYKVKIILDDALINENGEFTQDLNSYSGKKSIIY